MSEIETSVPPAGEEIHLPGPSAIPLVNAAGITLIVVGTTISRYFIAVGIVVFVISTLMWIRDTRREIDDLPEEHHS